MSVCFEFNSSIFGISPIFLDLLTDAAIFSCILLQIPVYSGNSKKNPPRKGQPLYKEHFQYPQKCICNTIELPKRGQPPYKRQNDWSQSVVYSEVPLYTHTIKTLGKLTKDDTGFNQYYKTVHKYSNTWKIRKFTLTCPHSTCTKYKYKNTNTVTN